MLTRMNARALPGDDAEGEEGAEEGEAVFDEGDAEVGPAAGVNQMVANVVSAEGTEGGRDDAEEDAFDDGA